MAHHIFGTEVCLDRGKCIGQGVRVKVPLADVVNHFRADHPRVGYERGPRPNEEGYALVYIDREFDYLDLSRGTLLAVFYGSTNWDGDLAVAWVPKLPKGLNLEAAQRRHKRLRDDGLQDAFDCLGFNP